MFLPGDHSVLIGCKVTLVPVSLFDSEEEDDPLERSVGNRVLRLGIDRGDRSRARGESIDLGDVHDT